MNWWWCPPFRWTGMRVYRSAAGGWYVLWKGGGMHITFERFE